MRSRVGEHSNYRGRSDGQGNLDRPVKVDMQMTVIEGRIGVPRKGFSPRALLENSDLLTSPSSEQVRKRLGEFSVTILFTLSACDL